MANTNAINNPDHFTRDELIAILRAFGDLSNQVQVHEFNEETGSQGSEDEANYAVAREAYWKNYRRNN